MKRSLAGVANLAIALILALALVLASTSAAAAPDTRLMVLKFADLPAGFSLDKGYYVNNARAANLGGVTLAQLTRWGRITGYSAEFSREDTTGIMFIESTASTYKTVKGAADSLHHGYKMEGAKQQLEGQTVVAKRVSTVARIGQESRMFSRNFRYQGVPFTSYELLWRYQAVKAALMTLSISGTVKAADVIKLAQKQQARIAATAT